MVYHLVIRTYGTWLPGDERTSIHQPLNAIGDEKIESRPHLERYVQSRMNHKPIILNNAMRSCVEKALEQTCAYRQWEIHELNVRQNHFHIVIGGECNPEKMVVDLKAWATRALREQKLVDKGLTIWAEHGSTTYINSFDEFQNVCDYVRNQQGPDLHDQP